MQLCRNLGAVFVEDSEKLPAVRGEVEGQEGGWGLSCDVLCVVFF